MTKSTKEIQTAWPAFLNRLTRTDYFLDGRDIETLPTAVSFDNLIYLLTRMERDPKTDAKSHGEIAAFKSWMAGRPTRDFDEIVMDAQDLLEEFAEMRAEMENSYD